MKTLTSIPEHSHYLELLNRTALSKWESHLKRVNFGKQPLAIYQFVPCKLVDGEWVVLEEPKEYNRWHTEKEYQEALDKVLFDGFEIDYDSIVKNNDIRIRFNNNSVYLNNSKNLISTIEDLVPYNLPLTKTALKEIGL